MTFSWFHLALIIFLIAAILFAVGPMILSNLLAPNSKGGSYALPYECGIEPQGSPWQRFGVSFYVYALIFIAFDVDVLYLFPVSAAYQDAEGWVSFVKVFVFLFFLGLAIAFFWAKGVFTWPRRIQQ